MLEIVVYLNCYFGVYGIKIWKCVNEIVERVWKLIKINCMVIKIKKFWFVCFKLVVFFKKLIVWDVKNFESMI